MKYFFLSILFFYQLTINAQQFVPQTLYAKLHSHESVNSLSKSTIYDRLKIKSNHAISTRAHLMGRSLPSSSTGIEKIRKISYQSTHSLDQAIQLLMSTGLYEYVEKAPSFSPLYVPNDPFADSTFLNSKDGQTPLFTHTFWQAWEIEKGDSNLVIGIVDGGIYFDHEDLQGNLKINQNDPINGVNDDGNWYFDPLYALTDDYRGWDVADWDNNPSTTTASHGVEVTGVVAATPENGIGISGTGFNCSYVPYKIAYDSLPNNFDFGYDGAIIAAESGAKVINLSWGITEVELGTNLQVIKDVIDYIVNDLDVVVISASGNTGTKVHYFPAALPNVISTTGIRENETKQGLSSYEYSVDIAASGWFVKTTHQDSSSHYANSLGTSLAAPVVSGAAGLFRSHYPSYTAMQVMQQLRVSGDIIDTIAANLPFQYQMGRKLNPYVALTDTTIPGIRIQSYDTTILASTAGEIIDINMSVFNYLSPTNDLSIQLIPLQNFGSMTDSIVSYGAISMLTGSSPTSPFQMSIPAFTDTTKLEFIALFEDGPHKDYQHFTITLIPTVITSFESNDLFSNYLTVAPNPSKGNFTVRLHHNDPIIHYSIINSQGQILKEEHTVSNVKELHLELRDDVINDHVIFLVVHTKSSTYSQQLFLSNF